MGTGFQSLLSPKGLRALVEIEGELLLAGYVGVYV